MDKKEIQIEIINTRTENAKTFDIGNGKRRAEICIGALHYKDDYKDEKEQFKDIDLTWVNNKVTKAPYILERVGNKINVLDKKTGKTSSIELDSIGEEKLTAEKSLTDSKTVEIVKDVDVEIIAAPNSIRYQTIIKDEMALKDLKYKISGDIPTSYSAVDDDGDIVPLITSLSKEGILTESVDVKSFASGKAEKTKIKYPIKIDPTLTITAGKSLWLSQLNATSNYSTNDILTSRNWTYINNFIAEFDISSIPTGATITSASFDLYYYAWDTGNPSGRTIRVSLLRRTDWVNAQATWNIYKTGSDWGTAGAGDSSTDINTDYTADSDIPGSTGDWQHWNIKSLVEYQISQSISVVGVRGHTTSSSLNYSPMYRSIYYSTDTSQRPKLVIEYASAASFIPGIMQHNFIPSFLGGR